MAKDQDGRLAEAVVRLGYLSERQVAEAKKSLQTARSGGLDMDLSEVFVKKGLLDDQRIQEALQQIHPEANPAAPSPMAPPPPARAAVPRTATVPRGESSRRKRNPEARAVAPSPGRRSGQELPPGRRSGAKIALAFGASFLLSFPLLFGLFHFMKKDSPVEPGPPAEAPLTSDDLFKGREPAAQANVAGPSGARGPVRDPDPPEDERFALGSGLGAQRVDEILERARDNARAKNYRESLSFLTYLLKNAGGDPRIREEVDRVEAARRIDVRGYLDEARRRFDRGDLPGARRKLEVVLWWSPGESEAEALLQRIDGR